MLLRAGLKVEEHPFVGFSARFEALPPRVARFEGKQSLVVQVRAHAIQQRLLVGARQKGLEGIAGQKDQAEALARVERARVAYNPARVQIDRFALRPRYHSWNDIQTGDWETQLRNRDADAPGATGEFKRRTTRFMCQRTIESHTG